MEKIQMNGCCQTKVDALTYDDFLHVQKGCLVFDGKVVDFMSANESWKIIGAFNMCEEREFSLSIDKCNEGLKGVSGYFKVLFTFFNKEPVKQVSVLMKEAEAAKFLAYFTKASLRSLQ